MADHPPSGWTEADSRTFLDIADVAVPGRREQMEVLLSLVPAAPDEAFTAVDLCCGEGLLSQELLRRFPNARLLALDGSETMLAHARERLTPFGARVEVRRFDLDRPEGWLDALPSPLRCILSSLALHHIHSEAKRALFGRLAGRLERGGALLIADVLAPASDLARRSFAASWNRIAREQSLALTGSLDTYERAVAEGWNANAKTEPVPGETPSRLFEQLRWLEEAGFAVVDCFWLRAGLAVYGGYR
ncbi:MAG TPA: class I SAM-dependent methyltransferase [Dehalococcoidia bacterium]|nr:class I SAM-dependent methyltransferase [Dehalococcoidia bacterium]